MTRPRPISTSTSSPTITPPITSRGHPLARPPCPLPHALHADLVILDEFGRALLSRPHRVHYRKELCVDPRAGRRHHRPPGRAVGKQRYFRDGTLDLSGEKHRPEKFSDFRAALDRVAAHPNRRYFILKNIILNNLFGVDILEEAAEICKLRLFLKSSWSLRQNRMLRWITSALSHCRILISTSEPVTR